MAEMFIMQFYELENCYDDISKFHQFFRADDLIRAHSQKVLQIVFQKMTSRYFMGEMRLTWNFHLLLALIKIRE